MTIIKMMTTAIKHIFIFMFCHQKCLLASLAPLLNWLAEVPKWSALFWIALRLSPLFWTLSMFCLIISTVSLISFWTSLILLLPFGTYGSYGVEEDIFGYLRAVSVCCVLCVVCVVLVFIVLLIVRSGAKTGSGDGGTVIIALWYLRSMLWKQSMKVNNKFKICLNTNEYAGPGWLGYTEKGMAWQWCV